jgi:hypothetical protein
VTLVNLRQQRVGGLKVLSSSPHARNESTHMRQDRSRETGDYSAPEGNGEGSDWRERFFLLRTHLCVDELGTSLVDSELTWL